MDYKQLQNIIREILLKDWDPIGVGDNPKLSDEYDEYLGAIVQMIANGITFNALSEHLIGIENELGIRLPDAQRDAAVNALLQVYPKRK